MRGFRNRIGGLATAVCSTLATTSNAWGTVDLVLRPQPHIVSVGEVVEVNLYAVSTAGTEFSGMDVVLTWDPTVLALSGPAIDSGPHTWFMGLFGFLLDEQLDGLNADCGPDTFCSPYTYSPFNDGDAWFQAVSMTPATATPDGVLVTTLRFTAVADAPSTEVVIEPRLGSYSTTKVLQPGAVDVTGNLGTASVSVASPPSLSVVDVTMPAGGKADIVVNGQIAGWETFGVTLLVEIVPRPDNTGGVMYTPAPPIDIKQVDDPWPGAGTFTPFDTDSPAFYQTLNGMVDDNGQFLPTPLSFTGLLAAFPVTSSGDAAGVWDVVLGTSAGNSSWEGLTTVLHPGTLRIAEPGDGDADGVIDIREYSRLQACFTGAVGPVDPPAYPLAPQLRCNMYDFEGDGDVDELDYAAFRAEMFGPTP